MVRVKRLCIQVFHPIDLELKELKRYYGKDNLNDGEFIRWMIHNLYLAIASRGGG